MKKRTVMYFTDLVILKVIADNSEGLRGVPITRMIPLANEWVVKNAVPVSYAAMFTSKSQRDVTVELLEGLGFIDHIGRRKGYVLTDAGAYFMGIIGEDWKAWFLSAPVSRSGVNIHRPFAKYADDYQEKQSGK